VENYSPSDKIVLMIRVQLLADDEANEYGNNYEKGGSEMYHKSPRCIIIPSRDASKTLRCIINRF
jgi:hypothetical protein